MAFFKKWFSKDEPAKASAPPVQAPPAAAPAKPVARLAPSNPTGGVSNGVSGLERSIELLDRKETMLEQKINAEITKAKDLMAKSNKNGALACMKRKKLYEDEMTRLQGQRQTMETMKFTLQQAEMNREILEAQRRAGAELGHINAGMNAEAVEDDMEKVREAMDQAKEVADALAQPLDATMDDDELLDELASLAEADKVKVDPGKSKATAAAAPPLNLPSVVTSPIGRTTTTGPTTATPATAAPSGRGAAPAKPPPVPVHEEDEDAAALRELEAQLNA